MTATVVRLHDKRPIINRVTHSKKSKGYRYIDKDPDMDRVRSIMYDWFRETGKNAMDLANESNVSRATIYNWEYGKTRRPVNATMDAVLRAMGWKRVWTRD